MSVSSTAAPRGRTPRRSLPRRDPSPARRTASCRAGSTGRRRPSSSSCEPCSTMRPCSITRMMSAPRMVDRRCAITKLVRFCAQRVHRFLDQHLGAGVDRARRLVEDEDRGVGEERAGDREQLLLAGADVVALFVDHRVVAVGQRVHEPIDVGGARAASRICSSVASGLPYAMLSRIVPPNSHVSWSTMPIFERSSWRGHRRDVASVERDRRRRSARRTA